MKHLSNGYDFDFFKNCVTLVTHNAHNYMNLRIMHITFKPFKPFNQIGKSTVIQLRKKKKCKYNIKIAKQI